MSVTITFLKDLYATGSKKFFAVVNYDDGLGQQQYRFCDENLERLADSMELFEPNADIVIYSNIGMEDRRFLWSRF